MKSKNKINWPHLGGFRRGSADDRPPRRNPTRWFQFILFLHSMKPPKFQIFCQHFRETVILVIFGPNLGHETSNFGQKFDIFLKKKNCWNLKWFQENLSKRGGGFKKSVIFQNANRKSSFWKTYFVFQNRDFLSNFWKMTLFLKPPTKMKSHYITVILMQKIDDFLWKIRVFRSKLRHDCSNFFWNFTQSSSKICRNRVFRFWFQAKKWPYVKKNQFAKTPL